MATNIQVIKLTTGEEVLGELLESTANSVKIRNPVRIVVVPTKADPNNPSVAFVPFIQWSDDKELDLNADHVIATASPIKEFINQYNSMFGGIQIPTSKIITP